MNNHPPLYLAACARCGLDPDTLARVSLPRGPDGRYLPKPGRRPSKARQVALSGVRL